MKRLPVALVLLTITVGLCIGSYLFLETITARMTDQLDRAEAAMNENDAAATSAIINDFCRTFHSANRILPLFFPHEKMDAIEESAALLPLLVQKNAAHLSEELARCQYHVEHLRESERLNLSNLF